MKRLTLDKTWDNCLRMWKWIAEQVKRIKNWDAYSYAFQKNVIETLKRSWCKENGYNELEYDCFFCEFANSVYVRSFNCDDNCPARKINKWFWCDNNSYHFTKEPLKFYAKLLALNKIRLSRKRKCRTKKQKK